MALFSVTVRPYSDKRRPHLKYVLRVRHPDRKVERFFFETEKRANTEAAVKKQDIANLGVRALKLEHSQKVEALAAFERLTPLQASLTEAVEFFVKSRENSRQPVADVCARYIASREQLKQSQRHLRTLRSTLARFGEKFGPMATSAVKAEDIEEWLHGLGVSPISINSYRRILNSVFQYEVDRKRLKDNPVAQVELVKETRGKVGILTPAQMKALLAEAHEPDVLATIAIGGFAGLRPEEIARLKWSAIDIDHGQIDCAGDITKTAKSRYVKIEPVLAAWLRHGCATLVGTDDLIQGPNFRRRFDSARRAAGFLIRGPQKMDDNGDLLPAEEIAALERSLVPWPNDALRHSYASYHITKYQDAAGLALQLGHTTTKLIFSSYRLRVKQSEADAWWSLMPQFRNDAGTRPYGDQTLSAVLLPR